MKTKSALKGTAGLFALIFVFVIISFALMTNASAKERQTLRVGYIDYTGFIEKDSDGVFSGYGVDYLTKIGEYTDFDFEYVYGQWSDLMEMLANKEIDLICTAQYSKERSLIYDYSLCPIGYTQGLLYASKDSDTCYMDYSAFNKMTVGALKGGEMSTLFKRFAAGNGFSCYMINYNTEREMLEALDDGRVDAICSESLANHKNLSLIANFGADAYYVISYKNSPYMDKINYAISEIKTDVDFESDLYHKYYDSSAAESTVQFTTDEHNFIASSGVLTVGLMPDRSPLSFADEDGKPSGMLVDLMEMVSEKSGLKFRYKFMNGGQTGMDFLTNGEGDLVAGVAASDFSMPNPRLLHSDPLQTGSIVFVGRAGTEFTSKSTLTAAIPQGFINGEKVVGAKYPNFKFYNGTDNEDCLKAIRDGKADVMLQNMYIIRECLQSPLYEGLEIFPAYSFTEDQEVVTLPENEVLNSIINKALYTISDETKNNIVITNTIAKSYHATLSELAYKYRVPLLGISVLVLCVIIMILALYMVRRKSYRAMEIVNKKLEKSNSRLVDAVAQADRASTAKSQFLSRMSHEIRTPMNAIVGLTTIAKSHEAEPEKIDDYLGKIETSSRVLLGIINDVLDMSAIESCKLKISDEEFDIKTILTGITTIYYPQCEAKGIKFEMTTDLEDEEFRGDSLRVSQILLNLVSNAYKFTDKGGKIKVDVKESARKDSTAFIRFTVSDTGIGMSDEMKSRLFKPFEQETSTTAQKHGGSGLGLSIAKNLVDMMHGAINVESEKDKGTTFTIDIPFEIVSKEIREDSEHLKKLRILVVDDDPTSLDYACVVLNRIGTPFETADSGKKALELIGKAKDENKPYDVVMMDWKMPDMDGVEVTRQIRADKSHDPTVVIVSAYDLNQVEDEAKKAGADHFVSKPLFKSTVFNVLMTLTGGTLRTESAEPDDYDFTGFRVILAEDNELNSEIAMELLDMVHLKVDHAEDGQKALDMFKNSPVGTYNAILMDIQMPNLDGYGATKAIRALDRPDAKSIPIIAMTANAFNEDVSQALSVGMNGHVAKPIDTKVLYKTLKNSFGQK